MELVDGWESLYQLEVGLLVIFHFLVQVISRCTQSRGEYGSRDWDTFFHRRNFIVGFSKLQKFQYASNICYSKTILFD